MRFIANVSTILAAALLLSACLEQVPQRQIALIPEAENIRMSEGGRIFVAGADAVHEIISDGEGGYAIRVAIDEKCSYNGGLAQLHDWMFSVCVNVRPVFVDGRLSLATGKLFARSLSDDRVVLVGLLNDFALPNGIDAIAEDNVILVADEDFTGGGGVARAVVDFSTGVPVLADLQTRWIGAAHNVSAANGVRVIGNDVFLTDINTVKRVPLNDDGEPGQALIIYEADTVLDDLAPYCDGLLVADFIRGLLVYVALDGSVAAESTAGLASPSAVLPVATPLFDEGEILVTLVGSLGKPTSAHGDRLVSVTAEAVGLPACTPP